MLKIKSTADTAAAEADTPLSERWQARTVYELLSQTASSFPGRPALIYQLKSGPKDKVETLNWTEFRARTTQAANLFRRLGVGETDVVAYVLPNCNETPLALLGGMTAGIVNPINPLLEPEKIAGILRETGAKVVVTLAPFPKTDVAQKVARAVELAPGVETVLEVDLLRYLSPPLSWIVPLIRPKVTAGHRATVLNFNVEMARESGETLTFEENRDDRICSYFHTGGTTGLPKVAQHRHSGIIYNGWLGASYIFKEDDVLICPLPLFHVFGAYPVLMSCLFSGAALMMPTPAGFRGDGVMDNFWKLIERHGVTFMIMVPTAAAALMQRAVNADVSTLRYAICGSAPLPIELLNRFEDATGVTILEGYGMTEATCLVSINPPHGERKIGSVGLPFPYTDVRIQNCDATGAVQRSCDVDEVGEICVANPGVVVGETYIEAQANLGLFADDTHLRTGDLGRIDGDGYLYITGRAKDLIIRGGHNIDPALIEEALMSHEAVAFVGAIGQPDAEAGELPIAYVELIDGATIDSAALMAFAAETVGERAAVPKYIEILDELPKTAVGKTFKPDLRKRAISRVFSETLTRADIAADVVEVIEDKKLGLVAMLRKNDPGVTEAAVTSALGCYARPWKWHDAAPSE